jgi:ubiquinone/menaquinone biosynthesis C-methylase UbiE
MTPANQLALTHLIQQWPPQGPRVLELGATPETARGTQDAVPGCSYVGVDLAADESGAREKIIRANAHELPFEDASFDAVVTSSMFEHDPQFWRSVAEGRRVLAPGGRMYICVPGYSEEMSHTARLARRLRNEANERGMARVARLADKAVATRTYPAHMQPHDYYRFSPQAMRVSLLAGFRVLDIRTVLSPPRVHGVGEIE